MPQDPNFPTSGPARRTMEAVAALTGWDADVRMTPASVAAHTGLPPAVHEAALALLRREHFVGAHWSGNVHPTRYGMRQLELHGTLAPPESAFAREQRNARGG
jgi:hypothetical protein